MIYVTLYILHLPENQRWQVFRIQKGRKLVLFFHTHLSLSFQSVKPQLKLRNRGRSYKESLFVPKMAEVRGHKKKKISIYLSVFALTDNNTNSPKSSPNKFEDPNGNGVGLGIVAAMSNNNNNNKTAILAISPRVTSNPIPILANNFIPKKNKEDMEMCEEYTCVISHKGNNLVKKREYFDDQFIGNGYQKKSTAAAAAASAPHEAFRTADFLNTCSFCQKQLQGLDIFIYRFTFQLFILRLSLY